MTTNENGLAPTAIGNQTNNEQISTSSSVDYDTHTSPAPRKPRVFHMVHADSPEGVRTICGKLIPKRRVIRASSAIAENRGRVECTDCRMLYELNVEMKADKQRREKAEAIAEMVLDHLEHPGER